MDLCNRFVSKLKKEQRNGRTIMRPLGELSSMPAERNGTHTEKSKDIYDFSNSDDSNTDSLKHKVSTCTCNIVQGVVD